MQRNQSRVLFFSSSNIRMHNHPSQFNQIWTIHIETVQPSPLLLYQQSWRADEQQWIKIAEVHSTEVMEIDEGYLV